MLDTLDVFTLIKALILLATGPPSFGYSLCSHSRIQEALQQFWRIEPIRIPLFGDRAPTSVTPISRTRRAPSSKQPRGACGTWNHPALCAGLLPPYLHHTNAVTPRPSLRRGVPCGPSGFGRKGALGSWPCAPFSCSCPTCSLCTPRNMGNPSVREHTEQVLAVRGAPAPLHSPQGTTGAAPCMYAALPRQLFFHATSCTLLRKQAILIEIWPLTTQTESAPWQLYIAISAGNLTPFPKNRSGRPLPARRAAPRLWPKPRPAN